MPQGAESADLLLLLPQRFEGATLEQPGEGPEVVLNGRAYRGVPLRGAPAALEARYGAT